MSASAISVVAVVGANGGQLPTFQLVLGYLLHALEHASTVISEGTLLCLSRRSSPPWASRRTLFSGPTTRFYVRRRRQLAVYPADRKITTEKYLWSLYSIYSIVTLDPPVEISTIFKFHALVNICYLRASDADL